MHRLTPIVATLAVLLAARVGAQSAPPPPAAYPLLETSGQGQVRVAPDRATVTLWLETRGQTAALTAAANARVQQRVLDTLVALGLRAPEVASVGFNVFPAEPSAGASVRDHGYVARNAVSVRLDDLSRIGKVIDAALARGASSVADVAFTSTRQDSLARVALGLAAADARRQAEALAAALGGRAGELVDATTQGSEILGYGQGAEGRRLDGLPATAITPSDVVVPASVVTRWRFVSSGTR